MTPRPATEADLDAILRISRQTPWDKTSYLQRQLAYGNITVAEDAGAVRAFIVWNREFFSLPFIWLVVTDAGYRERGIASELFAHVEAQCAGSRLYTSTNQSHMAMRHFLERRGYRPAGTADVDPGDLELFYCLNL